MRKIFTTPDSKIFFDKFLFLMNTTYVKNGDLTVLSYPFKYLRECANLYINSEY